MKKTLLLALLACLVAPAHSYELKVNKASTHKSQPKESQTFKEEVFGLVMVGDNGMLESMRGMLFFLAKAHDGSRDDIPTIQYASKIELEIELTQVDGKPRPLKVQFIGSNLASDPAKGTLGKDWATAEPLVEFETEIDDNSGPDTYRIDVTAIKDHISPETENFLIFRLIEGDGEAQDNKAGDLLRISKDATLHISTE